MKNTAAAALAAALLLAVPVHAQGTPAPEGAVLCFVGLEDGAIVTSPVTLVFGLRGMGVAPAGIEKANTGHHHRLIDRPPLGEGPFGADEFELALPADQNHRQFGMGQTEVTLALPPGTHTLRRVLGDHNHVPHVPPVVSDVITVTVAP